VLRGKTQRWLTRPSDFPLDRGDRVLHWLLLAIEEAEARFSEWLDVVVKPWMSKQRFSRSKRTD
jgi:hypothetical protein